jgi:NADH:ubiquinone oxidoreductase subunit 6 (subunit J)
MQLFVSLTMVLLCAGGVAVLALVLAWQERAASPDVRRQRLLRLVLPVASAVLALMLGAVFLVMMVWSPQGAEMLASH